LRKTALSVLKVRRSLSSTVCFGGARNASEDWGVMALNVKGKGNLTQKFRDIIRAERGEGFGNWAEWELKSSKRRWEGLSS